MYLKLKERANIPKLEKSKKYNTMKSKKINDYFWGYLMILPTVGGLTIFYIYPFFKTLFYSFTDLGTFGEYSIVGISNYIRLFSDTEVWMSLKNTLMFTIISVPISIFLSIVVATLLNSKIKGLTIYRTLYFLPAVTMPAAIAMVWKWLYNYDYGLINYILSKFGIEKIYWVSDPKIALYSIIAISVWSSVGYNMVIFLAGIQNISSTYYEAAAIDGANSINQFFKITIPLLTPTIFFVMVMSLIGAFQVFDYIFMIIGTSNPALKNTQSVVYLFYRSAFELGEKGYASAIAIMLFVIIMLITIVQLKLQKKWVNY